MKFYIRQLLLKLLCYLNIPKFIQYIFLKNTITIVTYHAIIDQRLPVRDWCFLDTKEFEIQMRYLKKHFNVVSLSEAVNMIKNDKIVGQTAVVTFDDGFQNNFDIAFPVLKKLNIPASIFINTKFVDTNDIPWFCKINRAISRTDNKVLVWNNKFYDLSTNEEKILASKNIQVELKKLPHTKLIREVEKIIVFLRVPKGVFIDNNEPYSILNKKSIIKMIESGLIDFGAHTHNHAILSNLPEEEKKNEIRTSINELNKIIDKSFISFAYPNGSINDFDEKCIEILRDSGVKAAVTMISGPVNKKSCLIKLRRYGIPGDTSETEFIVTVHHFMWLVKKIIGVIVSK